MLKVININPNWGEPNISPLTVDSIDITIDSIDITADQVSISSGGTTSNYDLVVPFRIFESEVNLNLKNELTNEESIIPLTALNNNDGTLKISFSFDFKEGDNFEASIKERSENKLLWRGKIYSTLKSDLQNFDLNSPNENGVIKI